MDVSFDKNCPPFADYKKILIENVQQIFQKIGQDFHGVRWIIYDNDNPPVFSQSEQKLSDLLKIVPNKHVLRKMLIRCNTYGFCDMSNDTIYISTATIEKHGLFCRQKLLNSVAFPRSHPQTLSLFTQVVTDELAHIATHADHGSEKYETALKRYRDLCRGL